jgi:hypothetical protein
VAGESHDVLSSRPSPFVLLALCGACLLAGCGGSSSKSASTTSSPPTKAAYLSAANALCKAASPRSSALIGQVESATAVAVQKRTPAAAAQLLVLVRRLHTAAGETLTRLRALRTPVGGAAPIEGFLTGLGAATASLGSSARLLAGGHAAVGLGKLLKLQAATPALAAAAKASGLGECEGVLSLASS